MTAYLVVSYDVNSSGEVTFYCVIGNLSGVTQEYRAYLYDRSGNLVNKEPDLYWKNILISDTIAISTNWHIGDAGKSPFLIEIQEQHAGVVASAVVDVTSGQVTPVNPGTAPGTQSGAGSQGTYTGGTAYGAPSQAGIFGDLFGGSSGSGGFLGGLSLGTLAVVAILAFAFSRGRK